MLPTKQHKPTQLEFDDNIGNLSGILCDCLFFDTSYPDPLCHISFVQGTPESIANTKFSS